MEIFRLRRALSLMDAPVRGSVNLFIALSLTALPLTRLHPLDFLTNVKKSHADSKGCDLETPNQTMAIYRGTFYSERRRGFR
jgi:hypothetical protein